MDNFIPLAASVIEMKYSSRHGSASIIRIRCSVCVNGMEQLAETAFLRSLDRGSTVKLPARYALCPAPVCNRSCLRSLSSFPNPAPFRFMKLPELHHHGGAKAGRFASQSSRNKVVDILQISLSSIPVIPFLQGFFQTPQTSNHDTE
jgi:hypothetical protein